MVAVVMTIDRPQPTNPSIQTQDEAWTKGNIVSHFRRMYDAYFDDIRLLQKDEVRACLRACLRPCIGGYLWCGRACLSASLHWGVLVMETEREAEAVSETRGEAALSIRMN